MKRYFLLFLTLVTINFIFASSLDAYNIIIIPQSSSSKYDIIDRKLKTCFENKGFIVYMNQSWNEVPKELWYKCLGVSWEVDPGYGTPSTVKVELYDANGVTIQKYIETGMSITVYADVSVATDKIVRVIQKTPYNFKEPDVDQGKFKPIIISEDSVRNYLITLVST